MSDPVSNQPRPPQPPAPAEHSARHEQPPRLETGTPHRAAGDRRRSTGGWLEQTAARGLGLVAVVGLTWLVFGRAAGFALLSWDDGLNIRQNPYFDPVTPLKLLAFWARPYGGLYLPVTYSLWGLELWLAQTVAPGNWLVAAAVLHLGNVLLHTANVLLVYLLLRRWTNSTEGALAGAALFAVHPLHVETVAWVTETKGLASALGSLAALVLYLPSRLPQAAAPQPGDAPAAETVSAGGQSALRQMGAWALFVLALLAKPSAAGLPLAAWALDTVFARRKWLDATVRIAPWAATAGLAALLARSLQPGLPAHEPAAWQRGLVALDALGFYARQTLWPAHLAPDYGRTPGAVLAQAPDLAGLAAAAALAALAVALAGPRVAAAAGAIFLAGLLPVLGLVPFDYQRFSTVADRYAYFSLLGPALVVAAWLARRASQPRRSVLAGRAAVSAVVAALAAASFVQLGHWRDDQRLYTRALAINSHSPMALNGLGNLAVTRGELAEAERFYRRALAGAQPTPGTCFNLANVLVARDDAAGAIAVLEQALAIDPAYWKAHLGLAEIYERQGELPRALAHWQGAARLRGDLSALVAGEVRVLARLGRRSEAAAAARGGLQTHPEAAELSNTLAWLLATDPRTDAAAAAEAIEQARRACRSRQPPPAAWLDTLAAAYAAAGDFDEAAATARQALAAAEPPRAAAIRRRLELYQAGKPYHEPP